MRYYCNQCRKTITRSEYNYSMKKYKRALCRTHQTSSISPYSETTKAVSSYQTKSSSNVTPQARKLIAALRRRGIKGVKKEYYDDYKHVDISIPWAKLDIEIDGKHHIYSSKQLYADIERAHYSKEDGYDTIHIPNAFIEENVEQVADSIAKIARRRYKELNLDL